MNDNTRIRIKVPAHLYESVKKQLTLREAKGNFSGGAYTQPVKEKKNVSSGTKSEGMKSMPKEEGKEKTIEERLNTLEEMMKKMVKEKKMVKNESEKDQGYEAGKQKPPIEEEDEA
jgi:hypothetical protein